MAFAPPMRVTGCLQRGSSNKGLSRVRNPRAGILVKVAGRGPRHLPGRCKNIMRLLPMSSAEARRESEAESSTGSASNVCFSRREFILQLLALAGTSSLLAADSANAAGSNGSAYELSPLKNGQPYSLSAFDGKVTLFVNVASYCALTPQYSGLVILHDTFQKDGFEIVASPCNQFGRQEPESNEVICEKVKETFGARFLLLDKLAVNEQPSDGPVDPLYRFLRENAPEKKGAPILWNFEKFLVGTNGTVLRRYSPGIHPEDMEGDIKYALAHPGKPLPPKEKPYLGVK